MATLPISLVSTPIPERTTQRITFTVQDESAVAIPGANLTTLTVTLYDQDTEAIINSVDDRDILNTGGGTVDSSGNGVWTMDPADNQIVGAKDIEFHIALFEWTYGATGQGRQTVKLEVVNLVKVT